MKYARPWRQTRLTGITLFEPYLFFEAYKNYLQIDISAENDDDLRNWKGWVESRIRLLVLKIERHTYNMLQCHPHPHPGEFQDKSRSSHCCYFMGLQRAQGASSNEGGQFDIRLTVEDFKRSVNMYNFWKPGMEICVSHVKCKNIPNFVFLGGVRPPRPAKSTWDSRKALEQKASIFNGQDKSPEGNSDGKNKRSRVDDCSDGQSRTAKHIALSQGETNEGVPSAGNRLEDPAIQKIETNVSDGLGDSKSIDNSVWVSESNDGSVKDEPSSEVVSESNLGRTSSVEKESLTFEKIMSESYVLNQAILQEVEELEDDFDFDIHVKDDGSKSNQLVSSSVGNDVVAEGETSSNIACSSNGALDELEPPELAAPEPCISSSAAVPVPKGKPIIRLSFTSLGRGRTSGKNT